MIHMLLAAALFARITVIDRPIPLPAIVRNGHIFVPLRETFTALNSTVAYHSETGVVEARNILHDLRIYPNSSYVELDGRHLSALPAPIVVHDELYVSVSLASQAMGAIIRYDPQANLVAVNGGYRNQRRYPLQAPENLNPPPNATVPTAYPVISASLRNAIAASDAVKFWLDGTDVTASARFDGRNIAYVPEAPLLQGTHTAVFDGTIATGQSFSTEWKFTTNAAPMTPLYGAGASAGYGYQFYASQWLPYAGGSWFNLTLIGPPSGSGFAQICSPNFIYPLWNGGTRWYRERIALPTTYVSGGCAINATYISPNGQRFVVPITGSASSIYLTGNPLNPIGSWGTSPIYVPVLPPYVPPGVPRRKPLHWR